MSRTKLTYQDDDGRIVAITLHSEDKNLLVVGTYWPAGGSPEALNKRRDIDLQISNILDSNFSCIPLIMGDMGMPHFLKAINLVTNLTPMITCTGSL